VIAIALAPVAASGAERVSGENVGAIPEPVEIIEDACFVLGP
jgi:hypothetical protein